MTKRFVAVFLAALMAFQVLPFGVLANQAQAHSEHRLLEAVEAGLMPIRIIPRGVWAGRGQNVEFAAAAFNENDEIAGILQNVGWAVRQNISPRTYITNAGHLFIGADETAERLAVIAVSGDGGTLLDVSFVTISDEALELGAPFFEMIVQDEDHMDSVFELIDYLFAEENAAFGEELAQTLSQTQPVYPPPSQSALMKQAARLLLPTKQSLETKLKRRRRKPALL